VERFCLGRDELMVLFVAATGQALEALRAARHERLTESECTAVVQRAREFLRCKYDIA
jgi:hypothetical protein